MYNKIESYYIMEKDEVPLVAEERIPIEEYIFIEELTVADVFNFNETFDSACNDFVANGSPGTVKVPFSLV